MKKFSLVFNCFARGGVFIVCLVLASHIGLSQPEEKFSIQNKILQEKPPTSVAYSALVPESIFSNAGTAGTFYEQAKSLIRTLVGGEVGELQKEIISSPQPLPARQKEAKQIQEEIIVDIPKRFFPVVTKKDTPLQLIHHNDLQGTINTLPYERIEGKGVRFRYTEIPEEMIGHFWYPKQSYDLQGKTVRIHYSGIVPNELSFLFFRSHWSVKAIYNIHLEDSEETKTITFQIPDRLPFRDVSIVELRIGRAQAGKPYGDFLIEKVEVVESNDGSTSIKTGKEPKPFVFGGPYLQSNIWGGEVRAS